MPSYIELDKQASLPASSNTGKMVFGINSSGEANLIDNNGIAYSFGSGGSTNLNLSINTSTIGPKVSFTKTDYTSSIDYIVSGSMELTRGDNQGLYNNALEPNYSNGISPSGSLWNSKYINNDLYGNAVILGNKEFGWDNIGTVKNRSYGTWVEAMVRGYPPGAVGEELEMVMYDTINDKYHLFKFNQWTAGGNGGGFSYDRYELFTTTSFVRDNYSSSIVDVVTSGSTVLKRDDNGGGLYNSVLESLYDQNAYQSPLGTRWNSQYTDTVRYGFDNLNNVRTRTYGTFKDALNNSVGNNILSTDLIMHDIASDKYYQMVFSNWQSGGNGGGVSYIRTLIPENKVITFSNGTVKRTAGEPTYNDIDNSITYNIPEPGIYRTKDLGGGGTFNFPNPENLNGQKIVIISVANNTIYLGGYSPGPLYINGSGIASLDTAGMYEFTSINNNWYLTNSYLP